MNEQLIENPTRIGYYLTKTIEDKFGVYYWDGQRFMDDANQDNKLMFGIKRDWIVSFVSVESALQPKEQLSAEEYKTQVVIPIQIKHKNYCDLNGKIIPTEFILDKEHFFYGGYGYIVLHDFANNSEAMKENAIGFNKYLETNCNSLGKGYYSICGNHNKSYNIKELYNIYLTNK